MDKKFWLDRWDENRIGFHEEQPHPKLVKNLSVLDVPSEGTVFLPLCGKSVDFDWLIENGYKGVGAEFSQTAVETVFKRNNIKPNVEKIGSVKRYHSEVLTLYVGDLFNLTEAILGPVDAVFDRAALVALPESTRGTYCAHLAKVTDSAPQILVTFEYDQLQMQGPPFSITETEIQSHYAGIFKLSLLERKPLSGPIAANGRVDQATWFLHSNNAKIEK